MSVFCINNQNLPLESLALGLVLVNFDKVHGLGLVVSMGLALEMRMVRGGKRC
jgi:hypothetical protein